MKIIKNIWIQKKKKWDTFSSVDRYIYILQTINCVLGGFEDFRGETMGNTDRSTLEWVTLVLVIIGGINWGLVAFGFNIVNMLLGAVAWLERLIYILIGLSAVYMAFILSKK